MSHRSKAMSAIFHKPNRPKVVVSILSGSERDRWFNPFLVFTLVSAFCDYKHKYDLKLDISINHFWVDLGRNVLAQRALDAGADWMVFFDSDVAPPLRFLDVIDRAAPEQKIIILPYLTANASLLPSTRLAENGEWVCPGPGSGFVEISHGATGCMFICREVLEKVPRPQFATQLSADGLRVLRGEDYFFCDRAREAGFKIWTTGDFPVEHYHQYCLSVLKHELRKNLLGDRPGLGLTTDAPPKEITPCL